MPPTKKPYSAHCPYRPSWQDEHHIKQYREDTAKMRDQIRDLQKR